MPFTKSRSLLITLFLLLPFLTHAQNTTIAQKQAVQAPQWVQEGIIYSIFPRNFSANGDINSITAKLEEIKKLGVTILWLMPIQPIGQQIKKGTIGSPYSIQDYYAINPAYGTKADFKNFVVNAHKQGFKVIIDAVANHTSWDNVLIQEPEFYLRDQNNKIKPPLPEWSDVAALDYSNPNVRSYILDMLKYWLKEFDLDGFRLDASSFVPLDFWEHARAQLHQIKPDVLLLGEQDLPEALVKAFDLDYAWAFEKTLNDVITNGVPATACLKTVLENEKASFPRGALHLRFTDNHDKKRAIVRFGEKASLAASALIFTLDGVPLVYNGMEVGDTSETTDPALFEKIPVFWKTAEMRPEFPRFYQQMIALRKKHPALRQGEMAWVGNSDESRIVTYLRQTNEEAFLVAINFSNRPFVGIVKMNCPKPPYIENVTPDLTPSSQQHTGSSLPTLFLKPWEFQIYRLK